MEPSVWADAVPRAGFRGRGFSDTCQGGHRPRYSIRAADVCYWPEIRPTASQARRRYSRLAADVFYWPEIRPTAGQARRRYSSTRGRCMLLAGNTADCRPSPTPLQHTRGRCMLLAGKTAGVPAKPDAAHSTLAPMRITCLKTYCCRLNHSSPPLVRRKHDGLVYRTRHRCPKQKSLLTGHPLSRNVAEEWELVAGGTWLHIGHGLSWRIIRSSGSVAAIEPSPKPSPRGEGASGDKNPPKPVPGRGRRLISAAALRDEAVRFFSRLPAGERVPKWRVRGLRRAQ